MKTFRDLAERAICRLASEIAAKGDIESNWIIIDRLERRWRMIGCADAQIIALKARWSKAELTKSTL